MNYKVINPIHLNKKQIIMTTTNHPKTWIIVALLAILLGWMLIIVKHYNEGIELQEKIYHHSEIKDTV